MFDLQAPSFTGNYSDIMQETVNPTISVKTGNCFLGILHVFYKYYNSNENFEKY